MIAQAEQGHFDSEAAWLLPPAARAQSTEGHSECIAQQSLHEMGSARQIEPHQILGFQSRLGSRSRW